MYRQLVRFHGLNTALALSCLSLLAPGCGGNRAGDLDPVDQQLRALEQSLPGKTGDQLASLCLDYASICERAAGICLGVESVELQRRCETIGGRCENNLASYCTRTPRRPDAGVPRDASDQPDAGVSKDASVRYDRGVSKDAANAADSAVARDSGVVSCRPFNARGTGACGVNFGYAYDGFACMAVVGCMCEGPDCGRLYGSFDDCMVAGGRCRANDCRYGIPCMLPGEFCRPCLADQWKCVAPGKSC
jgi:hypothetical protein